MPRMCPCKDCIPPKRSPECHTTCEAYLSWQKEHTKDKEAERAYLESMNDIVSSYFYKKKGGRRK